MTNVPSPTGLWGRGSSVYRRPNAESLNANWDPAGKGFLGYVVWDGGRLATRSV